MTGTRVGRLMGGGSFIIAMSRRREFSRSRCVRGRCRDRGQVGDSPRYYLLTAAALDFDGTNHTSEETR
eukprot:scaffold48924_cov73-Cyclotella_meneghiniana.AAC.3